MSTAEARITAPGVLPRLLTDIRAERALSLGEHAAAFGPLPRPDRVIEVVDAAGLRGRGGAAFPTAEKLRAVAAARGRPVVVANGVEGEPASSKDRALCRLSPHLVLDGAVLAAGAVRARRAVVGIADRAAAHNMARALAERRGRDGVEVVLATVPDGFVAGEETALLRALEGGAPKPTLKPPYPFERGLERLPTLVQNVETLAHLALAARFGAAWFRSAGTADAPGTALVTLGGAVKQPGVHEIELGGTLEDLVAQLGGVTAGISGFLVGGYFGGWVAARDAASLRITPDALGAGAIVALPEHVCAVSECARVLRYLAGESAGQCGPCIHGLAAIAGAAEGLARGDRTRSDRTALLARWADQVRGRGACRHPDGAARFVETALQVFAADFEAHARRGACGRRPGQVLPL